ncbi:MFS transporter family glucose-6-phosphate receptor UhpC [Providencia huaxiensis]|uniref:MFS transporter family glucose-6-phosphate receptor UhpC n=1 Tax=Providencia huaxiensis TaxID=2027290 RepID=A0ABU2IVF5_9GAMM|nr:MULTISPECIES: MFS transporter family glucose-6-phosphate receptor UhpC [Providencia]MBZ3680050.1 MFS transporter family glucose-6-phosphate receptor UhpC [Providencia rettgeri]AXH60810.1 MFS transporter [Providencia huaxiensis]MBN6360374.1 MFS transporter family glucose-6-phosphate receptor UhpC [Providencia huaxiensis]MCD2528109.1 MFS transporter family glucose-6-phosphate receptor UhpC [Providencia huaxiensis]MDT0133048.1 MFS transporter family glucose-6-phosphate receptor UhpC [Providenc
MSIFKEQPDIPVIMSKSEIDAKYKYWRLHLMIVSYIGYAVFYFTRKSFNFVMPEMLTDLGITKADIGMVGTAFYLTYGASKFLSGIIGDRSNPRYFMGIGLIATGVVNILFGLTSSISMFIVLWMVNAFFQGWGWPPCAKILNTWYSRNERGLWWAIWNTSHNIGGAIIPILSGGVALALGWRYGMIIPGIIAIVIGIGLCILLRDRPRTMGLPTVGEWRNDLEELKYEAKGAGLPLGKILNEYIFKNKVLWVLAISYAVIYIVRTGINDWANLYLIEEHGFNLLSANAVVMMFEIGGFFGAIVAGWGSDLIFKGNRAQMNVIYALGIIITSFCLWIVPVDNEYVFSFLFFMTGFFIFGPQFLIAMAAAENSHKNAAGASTGFVSLFAYIGASIAGYPLSIVIEKYQWNGFYSLLLVLSIFLILMLIIAMIMTKKKVSVEG